jgi:hypothetical protein
MQALRTGSPLVCPDGAGQYGKVIDIQDDDDDDDEEDDSSSSDRWVSGSGSPGSFCLASRGPLGFWRLWSPLRALQWGSLGGRYFTRLVPDLGIFLVPILVADQVVRRVST